MTHKGSRVVKPQHNQNVTKMGTCISEWGRGGGGEGGVFFPIWSSSGMWRWNRYTFQACDYMIRYQF